MKTKQKTDQKDDIEYGETSKHPGEAKLEIQRSLGEHQNTQHVS